MENVYPIQYEQFHITPDFNIVVNHRLMSTIPVSVKCPLQMSDVAQFDVK